MLSKCSLSIFIYTYIFFQDMFVYLSSQCLPAPPNLLRICWWTTLGANLETAKSQMGVGMGVGWELAGSHFGVSQKPTRMCSPLALHELSIFPWYFQLVSWSYLCPFDTLVFSCHLNYFQHYNILNLKIRTIP